jgi:hypothetical protein
VSYKPFIKVLDLPFTKLQGIRGVFKVLTLLTIDDHFDIFYGYGVAFFCRAVNVNKLGVAFPKIFEGLFNVIVLYFFGRRLDFQFFIPVDRNFGVDLGFDGKRNVGAFIRFYCVDFSLAYRRDIMFFAGRFEILLDEVFNRFRENTLAETGFYQADGDFPRPKTRQAELFLVRVYFFVV